MSLAKNSIEDSAILLSLANSGLSKILVSMETSKDPWYLSDYSLGSEQIIPIALWNSWVHESLACSSGGSRKKILF